MALHDAIALEIQNGALTPRFRSADLITTERRVYLSPLDAEERYRVGLDFYASSTINTQLANLCAPTGYWVRQGQTARYQRIASGLYELLGFDELEELLPEVNEYAEAPIALACQGLEPWAARFACYLEHEPFQIYDRRRRKIHPAQPAQGLDARLNSYFWPSPNMSFSATEQELMGFIARAKVLSLDLEAHGNEILSLFASICQWGGVRTPTQDANEVVANLRRAGSRSAQQAAAMNSAWTKLYAMFYPDDFVIYDSRVATALVTIAEAVMTDTELSEFKTLYPHLGFINGRGGSRPRASRTVWRNAYKSWPAQLDANRLVGAIVCALIERTGFEYSTRQVEAVMFMEGY